MKKQYTTPEVEVLAYESSAIICASVKFGDGETSIMYSGERLEFFDEDDF